MIKLIATVDVNLGISKNGEIPWSFKEDLQFFKKQTENSVVAMGRKTFFSIPNSPLKNRINCVLSKKISKIKGVEIFTNIDSLLNKYNDIWIIGGAEIYNVFLQKKLIEYAIITEVYEDFNADNFINKLYISEFEKKIIHSNKKYSLCEYTKLII